MRVVFFLIAFLSFFQSQAQIKLLSAQVLGQKDSLAVIGAHVVNMNTFNATYTYSDGSFLIPFTQGDTIRISSLNYEDKYIFTKDFLIPDAIQITIFLKDTTYVIEGVQVNMYQNKDEFAEEFKNREVETSAEQVFKYEGPAKLEDVNTDLNAHIPLGSPISFLYNKFSKEAKEKKRLSKAYESDLREKTIRDRYNVDVVKKVTGIKTDEEAKVFMDKCPLEDEYVFHATDYDIVRKILECQEKQKEKE